jgi:glucuronate isomerase
MESGRALCRYFDRLDQERALPKTMVYNMNPADNYVLATAVGNVGDSFDLKRTQFAANNEHDCIA